MGSSLPRSRSRLSPILTGVGTLGIKLVAEQAGGAAILGNTALSNAEVLAAVAGDDARRARAIVRQSYAACGRMCATGCQERLSAT